jgi:hypothetical protein
MKSGKYIRLSDYNNVKIGYGTIDYVNLKTIYLKLNSWLLPNFEEKNDYNSIISTSRRKIKNIIYNNDISLFKKESIVDLDVKSKGIKLDKKSFMNLEVTLFINQHFDIKKKYAVNIINNICIKIIDEGLDDKNLFNFYKTKK